MNDEIITFDKLNKEKRDLFNLMEYTNNNLFITGKGGTGKSYLLKYFKTHTNKKVLYCAPTGIAASNINGVTIHSTFGWKNLREGGDITLSSNQIELFKNIDTLVIDEISMVRVDIFNRIDLILRIANCNSFPFGGKQIIITGDIFQLPPIVKKEEAEYFTYRYGGIYFFDSPAYKNGNFIYRELKEIFRQNDKTFIEILNDIRVGKVTENHLRKLNERYTPSIPSGLTQLVSLKAEVDRINNEELNKLDGKVYEYKAIIVKGEDRLKEKDFICDFNLRLKVGAQVMMISNDQLQRRWVNGNLGIITGLSENMIKVSIKGIEYIISPVDFNINKCTYNKYIDKLEYEIEASVFQYPVTLAYAITIHKSQGMTYQQIACNLDSCFATGQAYVALSRCVSFDSLYLTNKIDPWSIKIDMSVINFYNKLIQKNTLMDRGLQEC